MQGDFIKSEDVDEWIESADVILTINVKFDPSINYKLAEKLVKMKDGAKLVFLGDWIDIRTDDRFEHQVVKYGEDSVSWTSKKGLYYIATIDRNRQDTKKARRSSRIRKKSIDAAGETT